MKALNAYRLNWLLCITVCTLLLLYALLRARSVSFTHDEALSYQLVKTGDYFAYTANNHLLNTWLMALCVTVFGESELSLRLPNVLLFLVYLLFCSRLIARSEKTAYVIFAIPLLFLNPFVLDFFSLARGYGLSVGFMTASLYYALRQGPKEYPVSFFIKDFALSMICAALALLSNLSLVNFYIAVLVVFFGHYLLFLKKSETGRLKNNLWIGLISGLACVPLFFCLKRLMVLKNANDLYVGAGSFDESIATFIERSSYFVAYPVWFTEILQSLIIYIFPVGLIITLLRKNYRGPLLKLGILMTIILLGFQAEHYLFSTLFPISRTGIYFIPLFGFFIYYLFVQFTGSRATKLQRGFIIAGIVLVSFPLTLHFFKTMNLQHTFEWRYDAHTKEVMELLAAREKQITLGHNWIFGPAINYYIRSRNLNISAGIVEEGSYNQDFVYEFRDQFKGVDWLPVKLYDDSRSGLYRNKAANP